jgi:hypothetical protein
MVCIFLGWIEAWSFCVVIVLPLLDLVEGCLHCSKDRGQQQLCTCIQTKILRIIHFMDWNWIIRPMYALAWTSLNREVSSFAIPSKSS